MANDLYLDLGGDFQWTASGDLALTSGPTLTKQRLARRIFTNPSSTQGAGSPGDYFFHPEYGGGCGNLIGRVTSGGSLQVLQQRVAAQARLESGVASNPPPQVSVRAIAGGEVDLAIRYTDAQGRAAQASFTATS